MPSERFAHLFLSRYSPGTSSWGTSCVRTSFPLASPASCTPFTASASNAFPSSSNSSTLSESAPSRLDNPCKSPDCPLERGPSPSGANATVSTVWLFPRTGFLAARAVFPTAFFLSPAFVFVLAFFEAAFFASFALSAFLIGFSFLPAVLLVCFFLVFFLAAIGAVYHRSAIVSAGARMPRRGRGAEMERREERSLHYGRDDKLLRGKARRGARAGVGSRVFQFEPVLGRPVWT